MSDFMAGATCGFAIAAGLAMMTIGFLGMAGVIK